MKTVWHGVMALLLILANNPSQAEQWNTNSAQRKHPYKIVHTETTITAPLGPLLSLLQDAENQHQWLPYTHQVKVLKRPTQYAALVHFLTQSRWPFKPRDAVTLFVIEPISADQIRINMINQPESLPMEPGYLRIEFAQGHWLLTALDNCKTRVQYQSGSRWGGMIPQWLVDSSNESLAEESLSRLKNWAERHYKDYHTYEFLDASQIHRNCR